MLSWLPRVAGSPPRAWGLVIKRPRDPLPFGFTPTGVGTGEEPTDWCRSLPVHPHGRGDWGWGCADHRRGVGSPPRAWGLAMPSPSRRPWRRFTPTGVGTGLRVYRNFAQLTRLSCRPFLHRTKWIRQTLPEEQL